MDNKQDDVKKRALELIKRAVDGDAEAVEEITRILEEGDEE